MKKKKFSFLDLDDDEFVRENFNSENKKKDSIEESEYQKAKIEAEKIEEEFQLKKKREKVLEDYQKKEIEQFLKNELEKIKKSEKEAKKIHQDNLRIKQITKEELLEKDKKLEKLEVEALNLRKNYLLSKEKNESDLNKNLEIINIFPKKEKLEIKTNIYLKKNLYDKVTQIYRETGESRSAVINKMIEIALKNTLE